MDDLLSSDIEIVEIQSNVIITPVDSDVDDDYRTLAFRLTEDNRLRETEQNEPRILES